MGRIRFLDRRLLVRRYITMTVSLLLLAATGTPFSLSAQTFSNPLFASQDPYVTSWNGNYYFTQSGHNAIQIIKSPTLTGLKSQPPVTVWTSPLMGPDGHANLWGPEIHQVNGRWYIYFSADYKSNGRHRLYVLEGGSDPLDPYQVANTGAPLGQLVESTGLWAIDPNVFTGPDGKLYLTWSCTDSDIGAPPQRLCIAQMKDALHTASETVKISTPTEAWETRTAAIQEGPVGFIHKGTTYLTYSASASYTPNDYSVGVLLNPSGNLLDPKAWVKHGPIFDRHGAAYGPGSVVFVPSPDRMELWTLYHAYDRMDCTGWGCRSVRAQKITWDANGIPLLGYPMNPSVKSWAPSGDMGSSTGWGNSHSGTTASGTWHYNSASSVDVVNDGTGSLQQTFRDSPNPIAYSFSSSIQLDQGANGRYGVFALYQNAANHAEAFLDAKLGVFVSTATVGGKPQDQHVYALPTSFDGSTTHTITIEKSAGRQFSFYFDGTLTDVRTFQISFGQIGLLASDGGGQFRGISVKDTSFGWGDAFGDAAEGLSHAYSSLQPQNGYVHGAWTIQDAATVSSSVTASDWNSIYQGNPNFGNYTVQVDTLLVGETESAPPRYGLVACHDDRNNRLSIWLDPNQSVITWDAWVHGQNSVQTSSLPAGFDPARPHTLAVKKSGNLFTFLLDGSAIAERTYDLVNGTAGVTTQNAEVRFEHFTVVDR